MYFLIALRLFARYCLQFRKLLTVSQTSGGGAFYELLLATRELEGKELIGCKIFQPCCIIWLYYFDSFGFGSFAGFRNITWQPRCKHWERILFALCRQTALTDKEVSYLLFR